MARIHPISQYNPHTLGPHPGTRLGVYEITAPLGDGMARFEREAKTLAAEPPAHRRHSQV